MRERFYILLSALEQPDDQDDCGIFGHDKIVDFGENTSVFYRFVFLANIDLSIRQLRLFWKVEGYGSDYVDGSIAMILNLQRWMTQLIMDLLLKGMGSLFRRWKRRTAGESSQGKPTQS